MSRRFYRCDCRGCDFEQISHNVDEMINIAKSHEGASGHTVTTHGPYYEAKGNVKWTCVRCDFKASYPEPVLDHIRDEHNPEVDYLRKTSENVHDDSPTQADKNANTTDSGGDP